MILWSSCFHINLGKHSMFRVCSFSGKMRGRRKHSMRLRELLASKAKCIMWMTPWWSSKQLCGLLMNTSKQIFITTNRKHQEMNLSIEGGWRGFDRLVGATSWPLLGRLPPNFNDHPISGGSYLSIYTYIYISIYISWLPPSKMAVIQPRCHHQEGRWPVPQLEAGIGDAPPVQIPPLSRCLGSPWCLQHLQLGAWGHDLLRGPWPCYGHGSQAHRHANVQIPRLPV